jgi:translation initiation factor IF-3
MPPTHLAGTARALYRVFIQPSQHACASPLRQPISLLAKAIVVTPTRRHKSWATPIQDTFVVDENIRSTYINLVQDDGFHPACRLRDTLRGIDRENFHVVLVSKASGALPTPNDPTSLPTCKILPKQELRVRGRTKDKQMRKQKTVLASGKQLEVNWAIDANDLKHRLGRLKEFLMQGRKVEVMLGPKGKGKRKATPEEAAAVLVKIRDVVRECKGSSETKKSDGELGGVMTLYFDGALVEKKTKVGDEE